MHWHALEWKNFDSKNAFVSDGNLQNTDIGSELGAHLKYQIKSRSNSSKFEPAH